MPTFLLFQTFIIIIIIIFGCATRHLAYLVLQPGIEPGPLAVRAWSPNQWIAREFPQCVFWFMLYQTQPHQFSSPIHTFSNVPLASHTRCYHNWAKSPHLRFFLTILIPSFASNHTDSNHPKSQIPPYCAGYSQHPAPSFHPLGGLAHRLLSSLLVMEEV